MDLSVDADVSEIPRVTDAVDRFGEDAGLAAGTCHKLSIILDELLSNAISYGLGGNGDHQIDIHIERDGERLVLHVSDDGIPFNPFASEKPDTSLSVDERPIGGLGLLLVTELTESQTYERVEDRNLVTLIMHSGNG